MTGMQQSSLVVVANHLPIGGNLAPDGTSRWRRSPGGLSSALHPLLWHTPATWIGWAGRPGAAPALADVGEVRLCPVPMTDEEMHDHYEGFANSTLWPLYHDAVEQPVHHRRWWDAYLRVNRRFAEAAAEVAEADATVWVQDYHLQLVPRLLRELRPDVRIGFFLHVPFPPPELFTQLPRRAELLRGMLGADLVGFQLARRRTTSPSSPPRCSGWRPPTGRYASTAGSSASGRSRSRSTWRRCRGSPSVPTCWPGRRSSAPTSAIRAR